MSDGGKLSRWGECSWRVETALCSFPVSALMVPSQGSQVGHGNDVLPLV